MDKPPKKSIRDIPLPRKAKDIQSEAINQDIHPISQQSAEEALPEASGKVKHLGIKKDKESEKTLKDWQDRMHAESFEDSAGPDNVQPGAKESTRSAQRSSVKTKRPARSRRDDSDDEGGGEGEHFSPLRNKGGHKKLIVTIVVVLLIAFGLMHTVFATATIRIVTGDSSFTLDNQTLANEIPYTVINKNSEKKVSVSNVASVAVSKKATGTIILYNNYSTEPYDLIKTTRVQTENGSVYRLTEAVTIPGMKTAGGKTTPGSVNAKVEADLPGSEYNAKGGTALNLPGLIAGTDKYKKINAKVAANFTGGSKGTAPDTNSGEITNAVAAAKAEIDNAFKTDFATSNPEQTLLDDSVVTTSSIGPITNTSSGAEVTVRFTTKAIALERAALVQELVAIIASTTNQSVRVSPEAVSFIQYKVLETPDATLKSGSFKISANGALQGAYDIDQDKLKSELGGLDIDVADTVLQQQFPALEIEIKAWPFWKKSLPRSADKLKVIISERSSQ